MKIEVQAFINQIQDQTYLTDEYELPTPDPFVADDILAQLKPAIDKAIEKQALASFSVLTEYAGEPIKVTLETGIVNLPLQYIKKVNQFFELEDQVEVNLYLYVTSPLINRSNMRIDLIGPVASFATAAAANWTKIADLLTKDLEAVVIGSQAPKEEPAEKKAPAKKTATKKKATTKKKAAAKKTTKKATTKKTTTAKKTTKKAD
ncbi:hypothetical protein [Latilactobacillus fragifolii]|uniref:hypothetical protein n=1 Tax=Latilactobacillus fragifolii TaxID=2814244 RepID=UPI001ABB7E3C|nr:hypothetical protein [Latilactobacillus fragifolii]